MLAEPVPAKVRVLLTVSAPLTVSVADNVSVVTPLMVMDLQAEATFTLGLLVVAGIKASSPATGCPELGDQLAFVLQLVLLEPVQV